MGNISSRTGLPAPPALILRVVVRRSALPGSPIDKPWERLGARHRLLGRSIPAAHHRCRCRRSGGGFAPRPRRRHRRTRVLGSRGGRPSGARRRPSRLRSRPLGLARAQARDVRRLRARPRRRRRAPRPSQVRSIRSRADARDGVVGPAPRGSPRRRGAPERAAARRPPLGVVVARDASRQPRSSHLLHFEPHKSESPRRSQDTVAQIDTSGTPHPRRF